MKELLVLYHTQSGNTRRLAEAVLEGSVRAAEPNVQGRLVRALDAQLDDLLACACVVFATAEYNGYMSGALKDFFDRTFYPAQNCANNKPYAIVVSAGNDGTFAVQAIQRIARGYPLQPIAEPIIVVGEVTNEAEARCRELGETLAAGLALGIF